jgi:hypothetical protein
MRVEGSVESWSLGAQHWETLASLPGGRHGSLFLAAGSGLVVVGGCELGGAGATLPDVDRLDLGSGEWTPLAPLADDRYCVSALALGHDRWVIVGGLRGPGELNATGVVEILEASTGAVERLPSLSVARAEPLLATLQDGGLLVAGGYDDEVARSVAVYSSSRCSWETRPPLRTPRAGSLGPFEIGGRHSLWLAGSDSFEHERPPPALLLDRASGAVSELDLRVPRRACVVELEPATFLVTGGQAIDGRLLATTELVHVRVER